MTAYTAISRVILINSGLPHGRCVHRELGLVQELSQFGFDTVTDSAGVDEDSNVAVSLFNEFMNGINDGGLDVWIILRWFPIEGCAEPRGGDLLVCHIGRKGEIHRASLSKKKNHVSVPGPKPLMDFVTHRYDTVGQHAVDLSVGVHFSCEGSLRNGNLLGGFQVRVVSVYVIIK